MQQYVNKAKNLEPYASWYRVYDDSSKYVVSLRGWQLSVISETKVCH